MDGQERRMVGFTCAYTPLPLIDAAGFIPYRILPLGEIPDEAGALLHDNLCPHVKRVLDRSFADDLPNLAGLVVMASCDAMRRLADAWQIARPDVPVIVVDLPTTGGGPSQAYFGLELQRLLDTLASWSKKPIEPTQLKTSIDHYNDLHACLAQAEKRLVDGTMPGGRQALQRLYNQAVTISVEQTTAALDQLLKAEAPPKANEGSVPLFVFGNVLPDPDVFGVLEDCGGQVVGDDLCTGSRQLTHIEISDGEPIVTALARCFLERPTCARTLFPSEPDRLANQILRAAQDCRAAGVIGHVMKFCDPYLARLPAIRKTLEEAGLPLLVLEGDCTTRSIGQQTTRIEAFVEMLEEDGI